MLDAKGAALDVGICDGVGETHHTVEVGTMRQAMCMSDLVNRFLDGPLLEEGFVRREVIELLPQAREADDGYTSAYVGLAEDEVQVGDEEVQICHCQ